MLPALGQLTSEYGVLSAHSVALFGDIDEGAARGRMFGALRLDVANDLVGLFPEHQSAECPAQHVLPTVLEHGGESTPLAARAEVTGGSA